MSIFDFGSFTMQQRSLDLSLFVLSGEKEIQLTVLACFFTVLHSF